MAFDIVVHVLGEPFTAFHLDGAVHLAIARVLEHSGLVADIGTVFLFGLAEFDQLFALVLLVAFELGLPVFLSLGICKLDLQVTHGKQFVTASEVNTRDFDNQRVPVKNHRLVEIGNPGFACFGATAVEVFLFDFFGGHGHVAGNREHEHAIVYLERNRLHFLVVRILAHADIAFNLRGGVVALPLCIENGIPRLLDNCKGGFPHECDCAGNRHKIQSRHTQPSF